MKAISPCLWFDGNAEEAVNFYLSVFKDSKITRISHYTDEAAQARNRPAGAVLAIAFELEGNPFLALNGGPDFTFNEAISLSVPCDSQEELDYYWHKLSEGGDKRAQQCGWLKDKYGVSWQIVPARLHDMIAGDDQRKASQVMTAMLTMKKLDIAKLQEAYDS